MTGKFKLIPLDKIEIGKRRRSVLGEIDELADSIRRNGLMNPIVVTKKLRLVAGERRLRCYKKLLKEAIDAADDESGAKVEQDSGSYARIPVQFAEDLSPSQLRALELEENIKRKNMEWTEEALAVYELHAILCEANKDEWSQADTAAFIGVSPPTVAKYLAIGRELEAGNERVASATKMSQAYTVATREQERAIDTELSKASAQPEAPPPEEVEHETIEVSSLVGTPEPSSSSETFSVRPASADIERANAMDWLEAFSGSKFNFLHCDFPFGIDHHESDQGMAATHGDYDDTPTAWEALNKYLAKNFEKLMLPSCHVFYWFPMSRKGTPTYEQVIAFWEKLGGKVDRYPYIWYKSDNKGILPDAQRGGRRVYETALLISFGDRKIVKPVSNCYPAPATKEHHSSEKPVPMLKYFLGMLVDDLTEMIDLTCGSASALCAAEALGAKRVKGLELKKDHYETALAQLNKQRKLAALNAHMEAKAKRSLEEVNVSIDDLKLDEEIPF